MLRNNSNAMPYVHAKRDLLPDYRTRNTLRYITDEISQLGGGELFDVRRKKSVTVFSGNSFQGLKQEKVVDIERLKQTLDELQLLDNTPPLLEVPLQPARIYRNQERVHVAFQIEAPQLTTEYRAIRSAGRTLDYRVPRWETRDFHLSIGSFSVAALETYAPEDPEDLGPAIFATDIANAYSKKLATITLGPFCFADPK
jgi:hypothetical protein